MNGNNVQIAFVLLTSFLILIGYGHGIGPIVLFSLLGLSIPFIKPTTFDLSYVMENFSIGGSYNDVIPTVGMILTIGFLLLVIAIFLKRNVKRYITIAGIVVMLFGYLVLVLPLDEGLRIFSGATGIPFLLVAVKRLIQLTLIKDVPQT